MNIKLGSLFDGIGGFPFSASKFGITSVWASEIEPWPVKATSKHFPGMTHLGDITKINGAEIEPTDVITFGSPCTRLSVAGRHDGFDISFKCEGSNDQPHDCYKKTIRATDKYQYLYKDICPICGKELSETNESALFFHAIRVIKEMRCATNGTYPRFIVWENVPGAFSSNKGEDFRTVLEEITETEIPIPRSGKWATAGMVRTERVDLAWRVLDAQYWGVPQRRRRIFLVADFGGQCAGEILFKPESLRGNLAEGGKTWEETAGDARDGIKTAFGFIVGSHKGWAPPSFAEREEMAPTLNRSNIPGVAQCVTTGTSCGHIASASGIIPFDTTQITSPQNGDNPQPNDPCHPLCATAHVPSVAIPCRINATPEGIAGTVSSKWAKGTGGPAGDECYNLVIEPRSRADECRVSTDGIVPTLQTMQGGQKQPCVISIQNATRGKSQNGLGISQDDISYTLDSLGNHAVVAPTVDANINAKWGSNQWGEFMANYAVRRLTPLECLRLQGYPDWWLDIDGISDTVKYKAVGNSVAIPCVDYVMSGIAKTFQHNL